MSMHAPYAVLGECRSTTFGIIFAASSVVDVTDDAPTTIVPSELPGDTRHASISRLPAETITGMPAARRSATALSSAGMRDAVSAMNDQFATAGPGCAL